MRDRISLLGPLGWLAAVALAVWETGGLVGCAATSRSDARSTGRGQDFRKISIAATDGNATSLSILLRDRPALLSFWAPWCEPCLKEIPRLEHLARAAGPCEGAVVGVAVGESPGTIAAFVRARDLGYPQFTDERYVLADALGQTRIPTTVVIDRTHRISFVGDGLDDRAIAAFETAIGSATRGDGGRTGCALR